MKPVRSFCIMSLSRMHQCTSLKSLQISRLNMMLLFHYLSILSTARLPLMDLLLLLAFQSLKPSSSTCIFFLRKISDQSIGKLLQLSLLWRISLHWSISSVLDSVHQTILFLTVDWFDNCGLHDISVLKLAFNYFRVTVGKMSARKCLHVGKTSPDNDIPCHLPFCTKMPC